MRERERGVRWGGVRFKGEKESVCVCVCVQLHFEGEEGVRMREWVCS